MIGALVGHLVGDYLIQNDWMALNKKATGWIGRVACLVHCTLWTVAVMVFSGWISLDAKAAATVAASLFALHYLQDRTRIINGYMWLIGQSKFAGPPLGPWSIIVVDNVWHIVTLWIAHLVIQAVT